MVRTRKYNTPLTLDYIIGCIISGRSNACNHVSNSEEVFDIFNFFGKEVGKIYIASNMVDRYGLILNRFPCGVFPYSHVAEAFGCGRFTPADTCIIIIIQVNWFARRNEYAFDVQVIQDAEGEVIL